MKIFWRKYIGDLFFTPRWWVGLTLCSVLFVLRFFLPSLGVIPYAILVFVLLLGSLEYIFLFFHKKGIFAARTLAERLSNGDDNPIRLDLQNWYDFPVRVDIIDEIPFQFQKRDVLFRATLSAGSSKIIQYQLKPLKRGEYDFGRINVYASSLIGLLRRRFMLAENRKVPVYPSYLQMRKYQLLAIHDRLSEIGIKKTRRIGHSMEFEQIKEYVRGDDYRSVNWKATARRGQLMVNHFADEKSQQIYCIIDKGRVMKMPFEGLSLLDYAVNASLVLSNVALLKQDKAGIVTFSEQLGSVLKANKKATQMQSVLELLYNLKTRWLESDFEKLYSHIRRNIPQRSLLVLFTNFESLSGMQRQLPFLRKISQHHLLMVVFFENTELRALTEKKVEDVESVYIKTIGEKFSFEKKLIFKELQQYGIITILTAPSNVTFNAVNKYLELKAKHAI